MKKTKKIICTTLISIACVIVGLLLIVFGGNTIASRIKYHEFYSLKTKEVKNPGLFDNYVPQGITYNDDEGYYATCGYMKDEQTSRIYTVDAKSEKEQMYLLTSEGQSFTGHTGGLQYSKGYFYLASEQDGVFCFSSTAVNGSGTIEIGKPIHVNNNSSFVFSDYEFIYVGEFARIPLYPCSHEISYDGITHTAIMTKYKISDSGKADFEKPLAIYSIPDEVQGVGVTKNGTIIVSRSWGITFASYDIYKTDKIIDTGDKYDGVPLYFLTEPSRVIHSTYFSEDIDIVGDKMISLTEAASNKYHVGKLIFDFNIFSFDLDELEE